MATTTYGSPYAQSADLVSAWPATSLTVADRIDDVSFKGNGVNDQTASYTGVLLDAGKTVVMNVATANTFTIPTAASVAYENGTMIRISNKGAGTTTVQPIATVTLNGGNVTLLQYQSVTIQLVAANVWNVVAKPAPAAVSSGLTYITNSTFSSVSSVSINNCFTSTYANYLIIIDNMVCTGAVAVNLRMRASGSDNTSANYSYGQIAWAGGSLAGYGQSGQTSTTFAVGNPSVVAQTTVQMTNPQTANPTSGTSSAARSPASSENFLYSFGHNVASAFDGFTIFPASGTFSGTIRVYGYQNS